MLPTVASSRVDVAVGGIVKTDILLLMFSWFLFQQADSIIPIECPAIDLLLYIGQIGLVEAGIDAVVLDTGAETDQFLLHGLIIL
jgi:hypothetical protein